MNRVMPTLPTYSQHSMMYDDYSSSDNEISYENAIRPSQMVNKHINDDGNSSDDTSSDGGMIMSIINAKRVNDKKTIFFINSYLHSFSQRIKILPESIQKTFMDKDLDNNNNNNNNTFSTESSIWFSMKTFLKLTVVSIIGVVSMVAIM